MYQCYVWRIVGNSSICNDQSIKNHLLRDYYLPGIILGSETIKTKKEMVSALKELTMKLVFSTVLFITLFSIFGGLYLYNTGIYCLSC